MPNVDLLVCLPYQPEVNVAYQDGVLGCLDREVCLYLVWLVKLDRVVYLANTRASFPNARLKWIRMSRREDRPTLAVAGW